MGNWSEASPDIPSSPTDEEFGAPNVVLTSMSGLDTRGSVCCCAVSFVVFKLFYFLLLFFNLSPMPN